MIIEANILYSRVNKDNYQNGEINRQKRYNDIIKSIEIPYVTLILDRTIKFSFTYGLSEKFHLFFFIIQLPLYSQCVLLIRYLSKNIYLSNFLLQSTYDNF